MGGTPQCLLCSLGLENRGSKGWPTDVCVPISRLADCILETRCDIEESGLTVPLVGHVGDGNFHLLFLIDPGK